MHEFLTTNRIELIDRCREMVAHRSAPEATETELKYGITPFLDQLIKTLRVEKTAEASLSLKVSGPSNGDKTESELSEIGNTAAQHGRELWEHGFTVEQVVHDYGDLCQAVTDLAFKQNVTVEIEEFRTLNRCLDNAIAVAVTEFTHHRDSVVADEHTQALNKRLGFFAHELRNHLNSATLALTTIKEGHVGLAGATGAVLDRSLVALRTLIDRSLTEVRTRAGVTVQHRRFSLAEFIGEVKLSASLEAQVKECVLNVCRVDPRLAVDGDRELLFSAAGNLLQNAFKFTHPHSEVTLNAHAAGDRILIDVEDHCGGLPPGGVEKMFQPFTQGGEDKTGLGLGLSISRNSVEANDGTLSVRDKPGSGCVFTIDLPRYSIGKPSFASHLLQSQS